MSDSAVVIAGFDDLYDLTTSLEDATLTIAGEFELELISEPGVAMHSKHVKLARENLLAEILSHPACRPRAITLREASQYAFEATFSAYIRTFDHCKLPGNRVKTLRLVYDKRNGCHRGMNAGLFAAVCEALINPNNCIEELCLEYPPPDAYPMQNILLQVSGAEHCKLKQLTLRRCKLNAVERRALDDSLRVVESKLTCVRFKFCDFEQYDGMSELFQSPGFVNKIERIELGEQKNNATVDKTVSDSPALALSRLMETQGNRVREVLLDMSEIDGGRVNAFISALTHPNNRVENLDVRMLGDDEVSGCFRSLLAEISDCLSHEHSRLRALSYSLNHHRDSYDHPPFIIAKAITEGRCRLESLTIVSKQSGRYCFSRTDIQALFRALKTPNNSLRHLMITLKQPSESDVQEIIDSLSSPNNRLERLVLPRSHYELAPLNQRPFNFPDLVRAVRRSNLREFGIFIDSSSDQGSVLSEWFHVIVAMSSVKYVPRLGSGCLEFKALPIVDLIPRIAECLGWDFRLCSSE